MAKTKKIKNNKKYFENVFNEMVVMGLNPLACSFTIYGDLPEKYEKYAKKRLERIKADADKMFKLSKKFVSIIIKK